MCDVLVLSAMSLSDGGFSSENSLGAGVRDVTAEHASVVADLEKARAEAAKDKLAAEAARKGEQIAKDAHI